MKIDQVVYVARDGHKGIALGPKGETIKAVGQAAREELKGFLGREVHLFLTVKVRPGWLDERERYGEIGLDFPEGKRMSAPRLTAEFWVQAYLARLRLADIPAFVTARGDATAGAVAVKLNTLDGAAAAFARAWDGSGRRVWTPLVEGPEAEVDAALERQRRFDPDLWVVEVEDRQGGACSTSRGWRSSAACARELRGTGGSTESRAAAARDGLARRGHPDRGAPARRELGDRRGASPPGTGGMPAWCAAARGGGWRRCCSRGRGCGRVVGAARGASRALPGRSARRRDGGDHGGSGGAGGARVGDGADRGGAARAGRASGALCARPPISSRRSGRRRTGRRAMRPGSWRCSPSSASGSTSRPARSAGRPRSWSGCRRRAGGR